MNLIDKLPDRLKSRKLWLTVGSAGLLLVLRQPAAAVQVVRAYLLAQGGVDLANVVMDKLGSKEG